MVLPLMQVKEITKLRRIKWKLSHLSQTAMVQMDQRVLTALRESNSSSVPEINCQSFNQERNQIAESSQRTAVSTQDLFQAKSATKIKRALSNLRVITNINTTISIITSIEMLMTMLALTVGKEITRVKRMLPRLNHNSQYATVLMELQELIASNQSHQRRRDLFK